MTFEFLIACRWESQAAIETLLIELLTEALEANQYDFDDHMVSNIVQVTHIRNSYSKSPESGVVHHTLVGFTVELDDVEVSEAVIDDFAGSLRGSGPIYHAIRLEDPLLQRELANIGSVIFGLEMKLRRVLSFIYLHAYPDGPYDLLREDQGRPMAQGITEEQMRKMMENQFFHLTFRQYIQLNQRRTLGPTQLIEAIVESDSYDGLRAKLLSAPIVHEDDIELLADLKRLLDPIERMRNCVAHNRRPDIDTREDYSIARPQLDERLDRYLADLEPPLEPP